MREKFLLNTATLAWVFPQRMNSATFRKISQYFGKTRLVREYGFKSFTAFVRKCANQMLDLILRSCIDEKIIFRHIYTAGKGQTHLYFLVNHVRNLKTDKTMQIKIEHEWMNKIRFKVGKDQYYLCCMIKRYWEGKHLYSKTFPILAVGYAGKNLINDINDGETFHNINVDEI